MPTPRFSLPLVQNSETCMPSLDPAKVPAHVLSAAFSFSKGGANAQVCALFLAHRVQLASCVLASHPPKPSLTTAIGGTHREAASVGMCVGEAHRALGVPVG